MKPRAEEIIDFVRERLEKNGYRIAKGQHVLLTGGTAQLGGLPDLAKRVFGTSVRLARPIGVQGLPEAAKSPAFASAVGLLVYPQVAGKEFFEAGRRSTMPMTGTGGYIARVGQWLRTVSNRPAGAPVSAPPGRTCVEFALTRRAGRIQKRQTMTITIKAPDIRELKPRITVFGVGGAGGNAVNNMIRCGLVGVDFVVANTDAQALLLSNAERRIQMGIQVTEGLGAGSQPEVGRSAAEEVIDEIRDQLAHVHMAFITAGMGGGTGTGAAPVIARVAREMGILTVGVVTKPFHFEGQRRMRVAEAGISELQKAVDTLIVIPNQNLFRVANEKTTFAEAFAMADQVLLSGVASVTDLIVKPGLINLDFADVRAVMRDMGKAMMGTGEASGEPRHHGCGSRDCEPAA